MNGKDWTGYCPEHSAVVQRIDDLHNDFKALDKEVDAMKIQITEIKVKLSIIVALSAAIGGALANVVMSLVRG